MEQCFNAAPWLCARYQDAFPFWEILATAIITGLVTFLTIVFATRSARETTNRSLSHAALLNREAMEQADRTARWQARMSEVVALRLAIESALESSTSSDRDIRRQARVEMNEAETRLRVSLTPGAPELLRVVKFELGAYARPAKKLNKQSATAAIGEGYVRRTMLIELIESWGRDPDKRTPELVKRAAAVDQLSDERGREMVEDLLKALAHPDAAEEPEG